VSRKAKKFTISECSRIYSAHEAGVPIGAIARWYHVGTEAISRVLNPLKWRPVQLEFKFESPTGAK
jgi:hypothetical protein